MFIEYRKGVLNMGGTISEKELEKYDYLREEYYKKKKSWPYTPRPLTNYEKAVINGSGLLLDSYGEGEYLRAKTYADLPLSDLYLLIKSTEKTSNSTTAALVFMKDELLPFKGKGKNFSKMEVETILSVIYTIYKQFVEKANKIGKVIGVLDDESKSILGVLDGSEYYNKNKSKLAEKFLKHKYDESKNKDGLKDFYFDPGDVMLLCSTVLKSIPQNARDEIKNRETYLSNKKSRDYSDFMDMRKKMIELYNKGKFAQGDKLLSEYTGLEYSLINGAARHSFSLDFGSKQGATSVYELAGKNSKIIDEDLFIKGVIELAELRKKLKESSWDCKDEDVKYLYRGIPLYELLQKVQKVRGEEMPKELEKKHTFEKNLRDEVAKYLVGKVVVDPAPSSTSLDISVAEGFSFDDMYDTAAILVIDVSKYRKGLDLASISRLSDEKEILLPLGVKLEIKSVNFKKEGSDGYFEVNCVPV